jgi:hypothetical protein
LLLPEPPFAKSPFLGSVIIEGFSTVEIAVCVGAGGDSRFLASLGMTLKGWLEARS